MGRFVFIDNNDPTAVFESQLRDPEGLTRIDSDGEIVLIITSSLCASVITPRVVSRNRGWSRAAPDAPWPCRPE